MKSKRLTDKSNDDMEEKDMTNPFPRMFYWLALVGIVAVLFGSCASQPTATEAVTTPAVPVTDLIKQADEKYDGRADEARVREGQELLRRAHAAYPDNYDAAWRLARMDYVLGDNSANKDAREQAFSEGQTAGEAAVSLQPNKPEGHFWLGANLGGYAESKGPLSGLASAKKLREEMEAVLRIDESYQGGSAYMALGQLDVELPEMLGGDSKRAVATLEKGLRYGDQNPLLRLELAKAYLATGRSDDARKQLNFIINMKPAPDFLPEYKETETKARQLLATRFSK